MDKWIVEGEKRLPVLDEVDVLIAGGGTAGCVAAIAAARSGVNTLVIEQFGALGGTATQALVTPLMHTHIEGNPMCSSISDEINRRVIDTGFGASDGNNNSGHFDSVALKFVLEEMAVEAGVKILYYTFISDVVMEDGTLKGLIIENKAGRGVILAKRIVDCTGDGDVAVRAGVPFEKGHPETGKNQPISVRYTVSGIDMPAFIRYMEEVCSGEHQRKCSLIPPLLHGAMVWEKGWALEQLFKDALEAGDITYEDGVYWQFFGVPGRADTLSFNCPEIFEGIDGTNPYDLTGAQIKGKKAILRQLKFYKKYFKGFENSYISEVAVQVGIRESRRIEGVYKLADEDILLYRKFDDYIARSNFPVDIHGYKLLNEHIDMNGKDSVPYYEIPFRCLVPVGVKGLLVAGRCISSTFLAQSSLRIQPTVRAIGEAAGIAAAMSVKNNMDVGKLDGKSVREEMVKRGARF